MYHVLFIHPSVKGIVFHDCVLLSVPFDLFAGILGHFFEEMFYLFIFRERGRKGEGQREKHRCIGGTLSSCLLHAPNWGSGPATLACAPTVNQTSDLSVCGKTPNPLINTSQGILGHFCVNAGHFTWKMQGLKVHPLDSVWAGLFLIHSCLWGGCWLGSFLFGRPG